MNQSQNENKLLTEEGFEFIGTDGKTYKCAMWGDTPWIFYKHPDGQWVSLKQTNQTGVWAAYEQRVNAESPIYPKKQSYQERVQAIAEEMAKVACGKLGSWNDENIRISIVESYLPFARIAVAEMSEVYAAGLIKGVSGQFDSVADAKLLTPTLLKEQGLIPDDGQGANLEYDPKGNVHNPDNPEPEQEADKQ